jgi:outer membrane protein OmpA-like peptidoglycan-associated protein
MKTRFWICAAVMAGGLMQAASAGAAGITGAEFLRTAIPAAAAARAAGVAVAGGSDLLTWNPAGISGQAYPSLAFTHFTSFSDTAYEQAEGLYPGWLDGSWAVRVFYDSTYDFQEVDEFGSEVGALDNHDVLFHAAYARPLGGGWTVGVGVKAFESALAGYHSRGAALDAGVLYRTPWEPLTLGAAVQNIGAMTAFESFADPLPLQAAAGAAVTLSPWPAHCLCVSADLVQLLAGDETLWEAVGLEYSFHNVIFLRGGYRFTADLGQLTLGGGLRLGGLGLDYAFQPFAALGSDHRFTLSYTFLPPETAAASSEPTPAPTPEPAPAEPKALTALPRAYEAKVALSFGTESESGEPRRVSIRNSEGRIVKSFTASGGFRELTWDGRDETGGQITGQNRFQFISSGTQGQAAHDLPALAPVFKLRFADGTPWEPQTRFHFTFRPPVVRWELVVSASDSGAEAARFKGGAELPEDLVWEGGNSSGAVADASLQYQYQLALTFGDGARAVISDVIRPIAAKRTEPPAGHAGQNAILITDIRFDFNRAELKPEMTDKILAAAEILRRHGGLATAVCEGHADEVGGEEYNQTLSERRARMVCDFLAKQTAVEPRTLASQGFGKRRPENLESTEEGRARNRRVEIRLALPLPPAGK